MLCAPARPPIGCCRSGVQPVKGQILRLAVPARLRAGRAGAAAAPSAALVRGSEVYLVPRAGGEVVVGATTEQQGHDTTVTAGGVYELLRNAYELLPISSEFDFVEALRRRPAGHRRTTGRSWAGSAAGCCWPPATTATASCCRR